MAMAAKPKPASEPSLGPTFGQQLSDALADMRAEKIRAARARTPTPSYDQIAVEVGCSVRTVYNIVKGITRAG